MNVNRYCKNSLNVLTSNHSGSNDQPDIPVLAILQCVWESLTGISSACWLPGAHHPMSEPDVLLEWR